MTPVSRLFLVSILLVLAGTAQAGPPTFDITVGIEGTGQVTLDPPGPFKKNNMVTVTAIPGEGYVFDHWEGDLAGDLNPATLRVSGDHTVLAVFTNDSGGGDPGGGDPGGGGNGSGVHPSPLPESGMLVGYFTSWSVYRRAYYPGDIENSGAAERLDVINYAFAGIDENFQCEILDSFADYDKAFDANETVDGVADSHSQPLKGNFNQLRKLKGMYPDLRVLISIGGWSESYRFSDMASTREGREAFISSCIDMFIRGNVAEGVSAAGVFDGIDIDWEYPGRCGATCDYREEDPQNFALLLEEFRAALEREESNVADVVGTRPEYLLTIAAPAGEYYYEVFPSASIHGALDWINIMAYDFHGGWESSGPANHHAPLYRSECDDEATADYGDKAVRAYLGEGVPGSKLLLGVPFYGRGWRGVAAADDGLCNPARGVPRGTYEKGVDDYEVLANSGDPIFHEEDSSAAWTFDGNEFWSFDDPESLGTKAGYTLDNGLRGVMFWELSGDDPGASLVRALRDGMTAP